MLKMIKKALLFILISVVEIINAQDAILKGLITDDQTHEPLIGALVMVEGTELVVESDIEGNYSIAIPAGKHQVIFGYDTYHSDTLKNLVLTAGQVLYKNVGLKASVTQMETVVLIQKTEKNSAEEVLKSRKEATTTSDGIDQKTLTKSNNPTVSDGLKKVTGASIQDGKFAIIRGMGDRYNAGYINGAPLPSTESDRKAFSFDILPTSLVDNLIILKSGSADLTGDFGGGVIKISTKSIPDSFIVNVGLGGQYNSVTTNKTYKAFKGSSTDWLGFDDGLRSRPDLTESNNLALTNNVGANLPKYVSDTKKFNNDFVHENFKAPFGSRFNFAIGAPFIKKERFELGAIAAYGYNQTFTRTERNTNFFKAIDDDGNMIADQSSSFNDITGVRAVNNSALANVGVKIAKNHKIDWKNTYGLNTSITDLARKGKAYSSDGDQEVTQYVNLMQYNRMFTSQLNGVHDLFSKRLKADWNMSLAEIKKKIPDYRVVTYSKSLVPDEETGALYTYIVKADRFSDGQGRFFSDLDENLKSGGFNLNYKLNDGDSALVTTNVKAGFFIQERNRDFGFDSYAYHTVPGNAPNPDTISKNFNAEQFDKDKVYMFNQARKGEKFYKGASHLKAYYVMLDQNFCKKLKLSYGLRYETFAQTVTTADVKNEQSKNVILPSVNFNYKISPNKSNLRLAYYKSVNRPEFREIASFAFFDFLQNADIQGNNKLKQADISNFEGRYEYLPSPDQMISVGGFYKTINNPIEIRYDWSQVTYRTFLYANENKAKVYGLELEYKKTFDFLSKATGVKGFDFFFFTSNLTLVQSRVETLLGSPSLNNRPLQGQSPYLVNLSFGYDNKNNGWSSTISLNKYGRRLAFVGRTADEETGLRPNPDFGYDTYENPRTVVDFQVSKTFKRYSIKGTLGDLLHQDLVFYNDVNGNRKYDGNRSQDLTIFKNNIGYTFTLAASANF